MSGVSSRFSSPYRVESFLRSQWVVVPDPDFAEYIQAPEYQLSRGRLTGRLMGDCDDAATLAASLFAALRVPCSLIAIRMPGDQEFSHVFCRSDYGDVDPIVPESQLPITNHAEEMEVVVWPAR